MKNRIIELVALMMLVGLTLLAVAQSADKDKPKTMGLVVVDAAGKEQTLSNYRFTFGTRRLNWLASPENKLAPEAVMIRAQNKLIFKDGVVTLIPLDRLRSITFDSDRSLLIVKAATGSTPTDEVTLEGTTAYKGINKITLQADVERGEAGIASLTFQGGVLRGSIRQLRFPSHKVEPIKLGRPAVVRTREKNLEQTHVVSDLQALYRVAGGEKRADSLFFHKTLKLNLADIRQIVATGEDSEDLIWQVLPKSGEESTLTLLLQAKLDNQDASLVGLLGQINVGWKLFPVRQVRDIHFDTTEIPAAGADQKAPQKKSGAAR
jgi:hypothetical protein